MSRTGIEVKLPWQQIPKAVRQQVDAALGSPFLLIALGGRTFLGCHVCVAFNANNWAS